MPLSTCRECLSCLEYFCDTCDQGGQCVSCGEPMCEECHLQANEDEERNGLCYTCYDPWLSNVQYLGTDRRSTQSLKSRRGKLK